MLGNRSENARLQSNFYRDQFRRILNWIMVAIVIIFILAALDIFLILFQPGPRYYANTLDGRILSMPTPIRDNATH